MSTRWLKETLHLFVNDFKESWQNLRFLDLKTLDAADLSGINFVHVDVSVLLQLVLPYAVRGNHQLLVSQQTTYDHSQIYLIQETYTS